MKKHRWTRPQINYIREKYPTTPAKVLAAEFGVSISCMERRIKAYKIKKFDHNHIFIDDVCECGVTRKRVEVWAYSKDNFKTRQISPLFLNVQNINPETNMAIVKKRWDETHPYLRGFSTFSANPFWRNGNYTPKAQAYFEESLERMRQKDRLKNLTEI